MHTSPVIFAKLLTTTPDGVAPDLKTENHEGYVRGKASGINFAFTTKP